MKKLDSKFKEILGDWYGGPSISYDKIKEEFILYSWHDVPVGETILAKGKTLQELIDNYDS